MTRHVDHDAIRWGYVLGEVVSVYFRLFWVFIAYYFTKIYVAQNRSSDHPGRWERIWRYVACIAIIAVIAIFAAANVGGDTEDEYAVEGWNYNRGLIVFFTLVVAALFGVADGFRMSRRDVPPPSSTDNEW